jgi:dTDP-4-amino-4,6-dideoxygalactose transaminase
MDHVPFVDLAAQYRSIEKEIDAAIKTVLTHCNFVLGTEVEELERAFADFIGVRHAVAVSSGLDALRLSLLAAGIGAGDEVIVPANSFIASALAASAVGAKPVLVDCDPATYNIDPASIEPALTERTRGLMPVHLTGQAADMDPVLAIAARHGLVVIEDAAQAHGTSYKGRPCGSLGTTGNFSFYPGKNLGAYGDGGIVTTNDPHLAQKLRTLRHYGQDKKYSHLEKGLNARLDTLQAAVLSVKIKYLANWNRARARHAERYKAALKNIGDIAFQTTASFSTHIYHLFVIETDFRDELQEHLAKAKVQTNIHYPVPIHLQPAYQDLGHKAGDFPHAESAAGRMLSLPMFPELTDAQIDRVVDSISGFFLQRQKRARTTLRDTTRPWQRSFSATPT